MIIGGIAGRTSFIEVNTLFLISLDLGNMGCSENNANVCYSGNFSTVNLLLMIIIKYLSCLVFVYPYEFIHNIENKSGLEWLRSKSVLNFTGSKLRKLARLGDNLYNYVKVDGVMLSDMQVIKSPSFVDEFGSAKWQKGMDL